MNIHEFQAKALLKKYDIHILKSEATSNIGDVASIAKKLGGTSWVVKAQVHAGGRGKGGGVKVASSLSELETFSKNILGMNLITPQTTKAGVPVHKILIEQTADIESEFYIAFLINRSSHCVSAVVSREGGMDIEEVAHKFPDKIVRINIHPETGLCMYQKKACADILNLEKEQIKPFYELIEKLYTMFLKEDLALLEINPLILTKQKDIIPLDAKVSLDSNASFRHKEWSGYPLEEELKTAASQAEIQGFSFVKLTGNIGCMVNGAGLAMATMDMIQLFGGEPANFLDVGGDADAHRIETAFGFILEDKNVKGILVNIFGGIVRCDLIAEGIIVTAKKLGISIPVVVRLEGNAADAAKELLKKEKLNIVSASTLKEATEKIISLSK